MVSIKDIMSETVLTVAKEESVLQAAKKMATDNVSCLVVIEGEQVIGIISGRDIINKVVAQDKDLDKTTVADIMTFPVMATNPEEGILEAAHLMKTKGVKQLPVMIGGKLKGIVTQTDIILNITGVIMAKGL